MNHPEMPGPKKIPWTELNILFFIIIYMLFFMLILYKVFYVPVTHDEVLSAIRYPNYGYWQIMMYPETSANNHILNTLLSKFSQSLFGNEQWALRLPSLLSFLVYAYAVFRICRSTLSTSSVFFLPAAILFIANPYLLDFFGLCRGYGLSTAFCTLSVSFLISGFKTVRARDVWLAFFAATLASYANFTLLVFWIAVIAMVWLYFFLDYKKQGRNLLKPTLLLGLLVIGYGLLIANPIIKMQNADEFRFWNSSSDIYKDTILKLVSDALYDSPRFSPIAIHIISILLMVVVAGNVAFGLTRFFRSRFSSDPLHHPSFIAASIVLLTALVCMMQKLILGTPYPTGRTAVFFFPLFISAVVGSMALLRKQTGTLPKIMISVTLACLLLFQIADTMKLRSVREWWFDAKTFEIIGYLNHINIEKKQTIRLKANWLFHPSLAYYQFTGKMPNIILENYDHNIDTNSLADYYYILKEDFHVLEPRFDPVLILENRFILVKAKPAEK